MARRKTSRERAQRLDPAYFRRWHPVRRARFVASAVLCGAAALWIAGSFAFSGEGIYLRGGFADAHRPLQDRCDACHVEAFGPVTDPTCIKCHAGGPHVPLGQKPAEPACASCHAEHGGRAHLGDVEDKFCNTCHERHRNVTSLDDHVQFQRRVRDQHIHYSHRVHLAPGLSAEPLRCEDCHRPRPDGRDFEPVSFDAHCARCHRDRLDPDVGQEVPHGEQPAQLEEWALALFLDAFLADESLAAETARPGRRGEAPVWATALRTRTEAAMNALLTPGRGCLLCHEGDRQAIVPPEIPSEWLPNARFDHKTHRKHGCGTCHRAELNAAAEAVDVPGVEVCRRCHGPEAADSRCVGCHGYHPPDRTAWR